MNNKLKQSLAVYICAFICWLVPGIIWASVEVDGIYYDLNTTAKTAAVASNPNYYTGAIDIPSSFVYNGSTYNVKSIGSRAFLNCSELISITFPSSVTTIGSSAFERCTGLTDVVIGSGVTLIDYEAFKNCSNLRSLTLPSSLKTIENETFSGCTSLSEIIAKRTTPPTIVSTTFDGIDKTACIVYVPEGCQPTYAKATNWKAFSNIVERTVVATGSCGENVTYTIYSDMSMVISGTGAIADYETSNHINKDYYQSIKNVIIEEGVISIGSSAFSCCTSLTSVQIPNSVTTIGGFAFECCSSLSLVEIPNNVTTIGRFAFAECRGLISVSIPNSLTSISFGVFSDCNCLSSIIIPNSVTIIGNQAFEKCSRLTSLVIPNSVTCIGDFAFMGCSGLTCVEIPNSVTSIGNEAFSGCTELATLTLPNSVKNIVDNPFIGCSRLSSIIIDSNNNTYDSRNNCNAIIETATNRLITGCKNTVIPNDVVAIGDYAFYQCTNLSSITIPSNVTTIGSNTFAECRLETIIMKGETPASLGPRSFYGSTSNCALYVPIGSKSVYENAELWNRFQNILEYFDASDLYVLEKGSCGENVTFTIYSNYSSSYYTLVISGTGEMGEFSGWDDYDDEEMGSVARYGRSSNWTRADKVIIEGGVTSIGNKAFENCVCLTSVYIPTSVTTIGRAAFYCCSGLSFVEIPSSVTTIGNDAFCRSNLHSVVIPSSVTTIGDDAFCDCARLTSVAIENGVISIGKGAFGYCEGLTSLSIPNSVTSIGDYAFIWCENLASLTIPYGVNTIGANAFSYCTNLSQISVSGSNVKYDSRDNCNAIIEISTNKLIAGCKNTVIPNSVTSIGERAFEGCTGLSSVTIPNSVTNFGDYAFADCYNLSSVIENNASPITINSTVFDNVDKAACTLFVPTGSKFAYENTAWWSEFENIVEYGEEPDTDISALDNAIYVEQIEGRIGGTMDIPMKLKNSYPVRGFQFTLELPEGATINSWALSSNRLPSGATLNDKIATQKIEGNKITVACSLNYGDATFTGNDGEIATVNVSFGDDMEVGTYPIYLTSCDVTTASGVDEDLSDVKASLVLEDYVVGDANGDGKVRIGDATTILNYIVGTTSDNFKEKAADANGDGKIRIGDATTILNIIVNQ